MGFFPFAVFPHLVKGRIEEYISCGIGGFRGKEVEGRVPCAGDGDGTRDYVGAILVGEELAVTEWLEGAEDVRPERGTGRLEVNKEGEGLRWVGVENAIGCGCGVVGAEVGAGVLLR